MNERSILAAAVAIFLAAPRPTGRTTTDVQVYDADPAARMRAAVQDAVRMAEEVRRQCAEPMGAKGWMQVGDRPMDWSVCIGQSIVAPYWESIDRIVAPVSTSGGVTFLLTTTLGVGELNCATVRDVVSHGDYLAITFQLPDKREAKCRCHYYSHMTGGR